MNAQREQIPSLVAEGMNGLSELLTVMSDGSSSPGTAIVESYFTRFKIWAGSLGAHRVSGSRSLQYRLRDASSIRTLLISLLEDLSRLVLREGKEVKIHVWIDQKLTARDGSLTIGSKWTHPRSGERG